MCQQLRRRQVMRSVGGSGNEKYIRREVDATQTISLTCQNMYRIVSWNTIEYHAQHWLKPDDFCCVCRRPNDIIWSFKDGAKVTA